MSESNSGFFKNFHDTISNSLDDVVTNNFMNLETNAKRVSFMCSLPAVKKYDVTQYLLKENRYEFPTKKDLEKARSFKLDGNNAVQKGDWNKALQLYNQSLIYMPQKEG